MLKDIGLIFLSFLVLYCLIWIASGIYHFVNYIIEKRTSRSLLLQKAIRETKEKKYNEFLSTIISTKSDEKRPSDWKYRRAYILKRDHYRCRDCGSKSNLQVHHKIQRSQEIDHSEGNLITLCVICHSKQEGHNESLVNSVLTVKTEKFWYTPRKGRTGYNCTKCKMALKKGEVSYVKDSFKSGLKFINSKTRLCKKCMLEM